MPDIPLRHDHLHLELPDPAGFTGTDEEIMGQVRLLRDQIKTRIEEMVRVIVIG